ncbi:hypothetical protein NPIL_86421, partial [Nephila pilipes]
MKTQFRKRRTSENLLTSHENTNSELFGTQEGILRQIRDLLQSINDKIPNNQNKIKYSYTTKSEPDLLDSKVTESQLEIKLLPQTPANNVNVLRKQNVQSRNLNNIIQLSPIDNKPALDSDSLIKVADIVSILSEKNDALLQKNKHFTKPKFESTTSLISAGRNFLLNLDTGDNGLNMLLQNKDTKRAMEVLANAFINNNDIEVARKSLTLTLKERITNSSVNTDKGSKSITKIVRS